MRISDWSSDVCSSDLCLGATRRRALLPVARQALTTALMPIINSLAATGLVSLPGLMTGQILAGVEPMEAVKSQLMTMLLIAGGTTLGAVTAAFAGLPPLTDNRERLRLEPRASSEERRVRKERVSRFSVCGYRSK